MSGKFVSSGAYQLFIDPVKLQHKLVMELFLTSDNFALSGFFNAYNLEMNWWSPKGSHAEVPVVRDNRPCLNEGLLGLAFPMTNGQHFFSF